MSLLDELKKLTNPIEDDDDFFEGADFSSRESSGVSNAQKEFESTFGNSETKAAPEPAVKKTKQPSEGGSLFGNLSNLGKKVSKPSGGGFQSRGRGSAPAENRLIIFNPKDFDEAGKLVPHLLEGRSVVVTLDGVESDTARRLMDFMSGITYALQGGITQVSAKTFIVSPENVDPVSLQGFKDDENYGGY